MENTGSVLSNYRRDSAVQCSATTHFEYNTLCVVVSLVFTLLRRCFCLQSLKFFYDIWFGSLVVSKTSMMKYQIGPHNSF